jgi:Spy/CpxP family protein refolding chaperone
MNHMKLWKNAIAASALLIATFVGTGFAQERPKHEHGMAFMATALDLTDAQVAQIKQIHSNGREQMQESRAQVKSLHQQLHGIVTSDNFDEAKAQSVIAQLQQLESARMLEHAREMNATYKVLNPQQKEKFEKLFAHAGHMGMRGHGGPDAPPAPPAPTQD